MKLLILENGEVHGAYKYAINSALARGGSEKQEWLLAQALQQRHSVVIASPSPPENPKDRIPITAIRGVEFIPCAPRNSLLNVLVLLKHVQPDMLYIRCATPHLVFWFLMARLLNIRTIFACASDADCKPQKAMPPRRSRYWPLYAWGLYLADLIFIQHKGQIELLSPRLKKKAFQVNNIVEIPEVEKKSESDYIAWLGGIRYEKRPDLLIEIALEAPDIQFKVGGVKHVPTITSHGSEYNQQVLKKMETIPNIAYMGPLNPAAALQLIANGKGLLTTSEHEGFPNVLLEAWATETPVVSLGMDPGGVIRQNEIGLVCDSTKEATLYLRQLVQNPDNSQRMVNTARYYVSHYHSSEAVLEQFENALEASRWFLRCNPEVESVC